MIADVVVDLQYGDCGKGKVAHHLCKTNKYTHVIRYNGGCNAGHTIYHNDEKFITHHIPCGVFFGIPSIIGPGCVVDPGRFLEEVDYLQSKGIDTSLIYISTNAHIITDFHKAEDSKDTDIATTKRGNGPAYRDKYGRRGVRAVQVPELSDYLIDIYDELHINSKDPVILFEGAQGFGLDVDWGDYPYITSSHCTVGSAMLNGVPAQSIRDVWGVAKIYETYVGAKNFQGKDEVLNEIREAGEEFGSTTGRPRQVNWLDMDLLEMACKINGVTRLVINKLDVLEKVNAWRLYDGLQLFEFDEGEDMQHFIQDSLDGPFLKEIFFSRSPKCI